jgi:hypothetical protein
MRPIRGFARVADREYVVGEAYTLVETQDRSQASHRHYFASVYEAWLNLPDELAERFPSSEHLRKYALIRAGYRDERTITCASRAEALRLAAFIKPMDEYAVVAVSEAVVRVYTAKSQSTRAMGRKVFQESKDAVLGALADMIGVTPKELAVVGGRDAGEPNKLPAASA